jgi:agmatine/peptidylarginine deiminase
MFQDNHYRLPAEWEPQSGIQLTWPHAQTDWAPMLDEVIATYQEMAREIRKREPLLVVNPPSNDTWARDHGFITLVPHDTALTPQRPPLLLDFCFNGWGEKFPADIDNALNRRIYKEGKVNGTYVDHLDFVLEGGSIESDGKGTVFTTSCCLLAPHRNQPLSKAQIEQRIVSRTELDLRHYLIEEIRQLGTVSPQAGKNWKFVPEEWTKPAAERDRRLLFKD